MRWEGAIAAGLLLTGAVTGILTGCVHRGEMCVRSTECASGDACVAGRCLAVNKTPLVTTADRFVLEAVRKTHMLERQTSSDGVLRVGSEGDMLALQFELPPIDPRSRLVEAYVLVDFADCPVGTRGPLIAWADAIDEPWSPEQIVVPYARSLSTARSSVPSHEQTSLRIDARAIVQRWRDHPDRAFGVAVHIKSEDRPCCIAWESEVTKNPARLSPRLELYILAAKEHELSPPSLRPTLSGGLR